MFEFWFTSPERSSFKPDPLRATSNPLNFRAFDIRTKMTVVRLLRRKWAERDEKRAEVGPQAGPHGSDNSPGMAAFCGLSAPMNAVKKNFPTRRLGGGRGARPETFSTFEHTRGGMWQGSRFECRSGKSGRTLWCLGAPTRTCCGVTQGVKLREQRRQLCQPRGGARPGETWKAERT